MVHACTPWTGRRRGLPQGWQPMTHAQKRYKTAFKTAASSASVCFTPEKERRRCSSKDLAPVGIPKHRQRSWTWTAHDQGRRTASLVALRAGNQLAGASLRRERAGQKTLSFNTLSPPIIAAPAWRPWPARHLRCATYAPQPPQSCAGSPRGSGGGALAAYRSAQHCLATWLGESHMTSSRCSLRRRQSRRISEAGRHELVATMHVHAYAQ